MKYKFLKHQIYSSLVAFICIVCLSQTGCSNEKVEIPETVFLSVENVSLNFEQKASQREVEIKCNVEYKISTSKDIAAWCTATRNEEGNLLVTLTENPEKNIRRGEIYIQAQTKSDTILVNQLGWGKAILLSSQIINIVETGGTFDLDITTNIEYDFDLPGTDWIKQVSDVQTRNHEVTTNHHHFEVLANDAGKRQANIIIKDKDNASEIENAVLIVLQKGLDDYVPETSELSDDIRIMADGVTGDGGECEAAPFTHMIDYDMENYWQNDWPNPKFPQFIEFTFDEPQEMDYIVYHPSSNGHFKNIEILVYSNVNTTRSTAYHTVYTGMLPQSSGATRIDFQESQVNVTKVKIIITDTYSPRAARCSEMEFYKKNPSTFDYTTLFTSPACTELKTDITETEILVCPHSFYKKLAWFMYNEKYPREFRIAEFKAYPHPDIQAKENKTGTYSLLDNPTGISVDTNERLVVMADLKGLDAINIRVQNLDKPDGDGFGGIEYTLKEGTNIIRIKEKGLIYVMYHISDYEAAPRIKLHFASGKVNGYFDSQNPTHTGRWNELIAAAVNQYFDVVGKYAHLTFPTARFRNYTKDGKVLINLYDELVYREQEFLGLEKYNRIFKNRMYFNVMYKPSMYATSYRTSYNESTLSKLSDETLLKVNCWGPAHEVGHVNQTRPGLKWAGTTEVTNNITALYIQTSIFGEPSRLESSKLYTKAWNNIIVTRKAHATESDVFCKLVPFWQLELYYGKVLGRTPMQQSDHGGFYPDVYEYVRTQPDQDSAGKQQLEFIYNCCLNAQANLLDFFGKWGFLTPIDIELDDYGKKRITITQADIDQLIARVEALSYDKPDVALEYITDSMVDDYMSKASMITGTAHRNGSVLTLSDWKHVVAFEIKDTDGKFVYVAIEKDTDENGYELTLPTNWKDGFTLEAVAIDGTRKKVSF